ncbi:MAG: sensor histidine kinase [Flavobacterium sp.]|nr:sensor histidine kinase [Flavobacterium sp.]
MKKIILLLFLISINFANAQNAQELIDGLKKDLKNNPDDKRRATIYSDLTWYYSNISIDSALLYGKKAIVESTKLKDSTLISQVYSDVGAVFFRKGDYLNSKQNYLKSYFIRKSNNDLAGVAKIKGNLANIYNKLGDKQLALKTYLENIDYFEKIDNQEVVAITKSNIGLLFSEIKNYSKALQYIRAAVRYQEKKKLDVGLCTSYMTLGGVYLKMKDTTKALICFEKSILASKKVGNKLSLSSSMINIASIKAAQKKSVESDSLYNKSKNIRNSVHVTNEESIISLGIIQRYMRESKFELAKLNLLKLKKSYEKDNNDNENLLQTYQDLIQTCGQLNQKDSVNYYIILSLKLQNKIIDETVQKQTNELETKYQTSKKEHLIQQQKTDAKQQNLYFVIVSLLGLMAIGLGYFFYKQQKIKNIQQLKESSLKETLLKIEAENQLQEQRLGISKELHDNIGSQLTFVISSIDTLKQNYPITNEKIESQLDNINAFTKNTITELRDTVWVMNTKDINGNALKNRLLENLERAKITYENINFKLDIENFEIENSLIALNLFRTIQEAINNALKYANATEIDILIKENNNIIQAFVKDNGSGFDLKTIKKGNGLKNMKKRIKSINGEFNIVSTEKLGTEIFIKVPKIV